MNLTEPNNIGQLNGAMRKLPNPENINGFISSLFEIDKENSKVRFSILDNDWEYGAKRNKSQSYISIDRPKSKFDSTKNIIFISEEEEKMLSDWYAMSRVEELYYEFEIRVNIIYSIYINNRKPRELFDLLNMILKFFKSDENIYLTEPRIEYSSLNLGYFTSESKIRWDRARIGVESRLRKVKKEMPCGLLLREKLLLTDSKSKRLTKWLKEENYISLDTNSKTINNLFQKELFPIHTRVVWLKSNCELKYFINLLYSNKIIKESSYNKKWRDVTNCFLNSNKRDYSNLSFSKSSERPTIRSQKILESITEKFYNDLIN